MRGREGGKDERENEGKQKEGREQEGEGRGKETENMDEHSSSPVVRHLAGLSVYLGLCLH